MAYDPGTDIACQRTCFLIVVHLIVFRRVLSVVIVAQLGAHREPLLLQSRVSSATFVLVHQAVGLGQVLLDKAAYRRSLEEIGLIDLDAAIYL